MSGFDRYVDNLQQREYAEQREHRSGRWLSEWLRTKACQGDCGKTGIESWTYHHGRMLCDDCLHEQPDVQASIEADRQADVEAEDELLGGL